ncbi:hypothetical protein [uncultured Methanobrevibacter sp.]|nr:hypothetical protein [uncultured Methanobrevibacter sp.]
MFCTIFPSASCCICVFVLYPCCMISVVNNKHKYIFSAHGFNGVTVEFS